MSDTKGFFDPEVLSKLQNIANNGVHHAVDGLTQMVGQELTASDAEIKIVPILEVPNLVGGPENEAAGIYLTASGQMSGQFMLILPIRQALEMVDLLMGDPIGTAHALDGMGTSALAEVGNLTGTFFLNEIASITGLETAPSPPVVMVDMVGAILNVLVATSAESLEQIILITTNIMQGDREVKANFWYIPDIKAMEIFAQNIQK